MKIISISVGEDKKPTVVTPQPIVEGENLTTEIAVTPPESWAGYDIRCLLTTPNGALVDAVDASSPVGLTNTMLDGKGTLYVEFAAMKGGTEIARTMSPALLPVSAARSMIGEIDPAPLPDLVAEMVEAKNTALTAAQAANDAAGDCAQTEQATKDAEAARVIAENARALQASTDHQTASEDHALASTDHTTAQSDHTVAGTDHTAAQSDHTTASTDHTNALTDRAAITPTINEVQAARGGFANLDARLDGVDAQLAQSALQLGTNSGKLIKLPVDFVPTLPCNFYRYNNGYTQHDMNFGQYKTGTKIYVADSGSDTTGTGAIDAPFKTMKKALETARDGADAAYVIHTSASMHGRYQLNFNTTFVNKTIAIVSTNSLGTIFCANDTYSWTLDGAGTYKCSRSGVTGVLDVTFRDTYGVPVPLIKKSALADCQATVGSWYADGTYLWVHRDDAAIPTYASTIVNIGADDFDPTLNNSKLYCENIIFAGFSSNSLRIRTTSYVGTEACFKDCKFVSAHQTSGNCVAINDVCRTYMFNCVAAYGQFDGFNYHFLSVAAGNRRSCLVLEYNCVAYHHGIEFEGTGSNNASTCHDGVSIVRFGTIGFHTTTPVIADIGGCYSILYDCESENPTTTGVEETGECYRFTQDSGVNRAKSYLINCKASRCTSAIYTDSGTDLILSRFTYDGTIDSNGTLKYQ